VTHRNGHGNGHLNGHGGRTYWPGRRRRRWRIAIAFGALGLVAGAATVYELRAAAPGPLGPEPPSLVGSPGPIAALAGSSVEHHAPPPNAAPPTQPAPSAHASLQTGDTHVSGEPKPLAVALEQRPQAPSLLPLPPPSPVQPAPQPIAPPVAPAPATRYPPVDDPRWAAIRKQVRMLDGEEGFTAREYYDKVLTEIEEVLQTSVEAEQGGDLPPREITCQFLQALDEGEKRRVWLPSGQKIDDFIPRMRQLRYGLLMRLLPADRPSLGTVDGYHCFRG